MDEKTTVGAPLGALLSDPKLLGTLTGLLGASKTGAEGNGAEGSPPSPLSEGIGSVLSNPELMAKLPSVIAMLKPMLEGSAPTAGTDAAAGDSAAVPTVATDGEALTEDAVPAGMIHRPMHGTEPRERCRNDLLLALKPFLSRERCEAVDMILRLSALGAVLKQLH